MNAHSASERTPGYPKPAVRTYPLTLKCKAQFKDTCESHAGDVRSPSDLSLITLLGGKDVLIDLSGIAEHDKTYVAHVFLRSALDVGRRDRAQLLQKLE